jgi:hypothetical protein
LNQIHVNSPADYEKGLAGIGIGIDYLIRSNFLSVEDDICEDFDGRMVRAVIYDPWLDFSQYNGLTGYGRYWITRLHYQTPSIQARECLLYITARIEENLPDISTTEQTDVFCFLQDLQGISAFESCSGLLEQCRWEWNLQAADITRSFFRFNNALHDKMNFALTQIPALDMEKTPVGTGLLNGYAGEGMLRLTALNQINISWMNLL